MSDYVLFLRGKNINGMLCQARRLLDIDATLLVRTVADDQILVFSFAKPTTQ